MKRLLAGILFTVISVSLLNLSGAEAARVQSVKGKRIVIDMERDNLRKGQIMRIHNQSGKVVGLAKIMKVDGSRAHAVIKGKAETGFTLKPRPPRKKGSTTTAKSTPRSSGGDSKINVGLMLGFNSATSETNLDDGTNSATVDLKGTGFSVKGMIEFPILNVLKIRGLVGLEQFAVGGEESILCGGECTVEINYLSAGAWGRFEIGSGGFRPWVGAGVDAMLPISKDTTAFKEDSITTTSVMSVGGGFDWRLSDTSYIPVQIEYGFYPSDQNVKASAIAMRAGYAWQW